MATSDGIILVDTGYDYSIKELSDGLKKFGLDPAQIKYVVLSHAHGDRYFGAKFLQDTYKARIIMSEADWNTLAKSNEPNELKAKKDMIATDGMKLTLGDTTLTLYSTPGHTPGTISTIIPLKDGNQKHVGSIFGGRAPAGNDVVEGVQYYRNEIDSLKAWSASAKRYKGIAESAGADVFLAAHDSWDKTLDKLNALKFRKPGDPHPLVSKTAVGRYQTVISECMDAQLAWRSSK